MNNENMPVLPSLTDLMKLIHSAGVMAADSSHINVAEACYNAGRAAAIPAGMVLVPVEAMADVRAYIENASTEHGYGFMRPANPHDFSPDGECCSPEEIAAHKAACDAYDKGEYTPELGSEWVGKMHILRAPWGIGGYTYRDEQADALLARLAAAPSQPAVKPVLGDTEKALADAVYWGTGITVGGKHVPYADTLAKPVQGSIGDDEFKAHVRIFADGIDWRDVEWTYVAQEQFALKVKALIDARQPVAASTKDAEDRSRLNWIEDQSDFGPIEITLGKGDRPNTTATYLTYGADDGSRISSGPARHVRAAIDQAKNPDAIAATKAAK